MHLSIKLRTGNSAPVCVCTMGWEHIQAGDFRNSASELYRRVVQVVNHAYEHVLKQQPYVDGGRASSDDRYSTPYINVVRGASSALHRHHDLSLNARRKTVKVNGQYKPLEGTAEHVSTLDELCTWVLTHVEARAAQAARREEVRRRQEEERRQLEADPVWQEQQREAARKRKQAEEAAAAARAERERIAAQRAAEAKKAEWEAKARSLAAKVQSRLGTPGAPGSSAAEINGQAPEAACGAEQVTTEQPSEPAFQLASCQSCGNHLRFCSDKGCTILLHGTCGCRESSMHPNLTKDMYEGSWKGYHCCECGKKFECEKHDKLICDMDDFVVLGRFCTPCWDRMCADLPPQIDYLQWLR